MILALGFFIGVFGALGITFFKEYLDHTFSNPHDISEKLGLQILGTIPIAEKSKQFLQIENQIDGQFYLPHDGVKFITDDSEKNENDTEMKGSEIQDTLKNDSGILEKNEIFDITLTKKKEKNKKVVHNGKIIAVTSSRSGEGVSTFSTYFASMLHNHLDKRVVIVDTNFEKPSIHKLLGGKLSPGLGEVLIKNNDLKIIQNNNIHGVDYIAAGRKTTNYMGSHRKKIINEILNDLRAQYDFIVLDTTPIWNGNNSKANGWESLSDGVILVVEAERVRWEVAKSSKERLENMNANILGAILNKRRFHIPEWLYRKL